MPDLCAHLPTVSNQHAHPKPKTTTVDHTLTILRNFARASILLALLAAPLALMPTANAGDGVIIEAPTQAKTGMGLVLLVSLQRV